MGASLRIRTVLGVDDPICSKVLSSVPIDQGVVHGYFSQNAEYWLSAEARHGPDLNLAVVASRDSPK